MLITRSVHREVHVYVDAQMPRPCLVTEGVLNVAIDGLGRITLGLTIDRDSGSLRVGTTRCARGAGNSVEAGSLYLERGSSQAWSGMTWARPSPFS